MCAPIGVASHGNAPKHTVTPAAATTMQQDPEGFAVLLLRPEAPFRDTGTRGADLEMRRPEH